MTRGRERLRQQDDWVERVGLEEVFRLHRYIWAGSMAGNLSIESTVVSTMLENFSSILNTSA